MLMGSSTRPTKNHSKSCQLLQVREQKVDKKRKELEPLFATLTCSGTIKIGTWTVTANKV
uniref:Uncharacterized protein n=1 Tax=Tetranychus urticae TaxID=32264 RepID=T1KXZ7_TETUR